MADIQQHDPQFMGFMFGGLDHGIGSISDGGGPLVPFLMTQTGDKKELKRFVTEQYEEGITAAGQTLQTIAPVPDFALIAFDGLITREEKKYDAILVRAFDKRQDEGFTFCQRYVPRNEERGIEPVGNPAFIGKEPTILLTQPAATDTAGKPKKPWWKF